MLICFDAGHGLSTAGKRCLKSIDPNETREWVLNSRIATKAQNLLADYNCTTMRVDDITGAVDVDLTKRVAAANNAKATCYVSIHANAGANGTSAGGIVVYIHPVHQNMSEVLQKAVYENLIKTTGLRGNRSNPMAEANFKVLRETTMPAVLCECGFMDSTIDTPIILTEEFADRAARGIVDGLVEAYKLEKIKMGAETWYTEVDGVQDFSIPVSEFRIELIDRDKTECGANYSNAGFFGWYGADPEYTLPAGSLIADFTATDERTKKSVEDRGSISDGKMRFDAHGFNYENPFYNKAVTVFGIKDGIASISEVNELPDFDYAVAGIPVIRDSKMCTYDFAVAQGWGASSLRATWHKFIGLRGDGRIHLLNIETTSGNLLTTSEVLQKVKSFGFQDLIKLDGGGSFYDESDVGVHTTGGTRRICSIIRFSKVVRYTPPEVEPVDEDYLKWKSYMDRYMAELRKLPPSNWAGPFIEDAIAHGITSDGAYPQALATREEVITMCNAAYNAVTKS